MSISPGADQIEFKCAHCQSTIKVSRDQAGSTVTCNSCLAMQQAPAKILQNTPEPAVTLAPISGPPAAHTYTASSNFISSSSDSPVTTSQCSAAHVVHQGTEPHSPIPAPVPTSSSPSPVPPVEPMIEERVSSASLVEGDLAQPAAVAADVAPVQSAFAQVDASAHTSLAHGMRESADPTAVAPAGFQVDAPPAPPAFYNAPRNDFEQPPKSSARKFIVAFAALLFIGVLAGVGIAISNGMERNQIQLEVDGVVKNAETVFSDGDVRKSAELARSAQSKIETSPQTLDIERVKKWQDRIKHFIAKQGEMEKLNGIFANVEKDLTGVRSQLESQKLLFGTPSSENQPVINYADKLLADVAKLELARKTKKLCEALAACIKMYQDGKIEPAAEQAAAIDREMASNPRVQDPELEKSLQKLQDRALKLKEAKAIRVAARGGNYAEQKRKLQSKIDALDDTNVELKPLADSLRVLRSELLLEEKRSRKMSAEDKKDLGDLISVLVGRDTDIAGGEVDGDTIGVTYCGIPLRIGFQRTLLSKNIFIESGDNRFIIDADEILGKPATESIPAKPPRPGRALAHALALGEAMTKAGVHSDEMWTATDEAPFVSARRSSESDGKEFLFLRDRLYTGKLEDKTTAQKAAETEFKAKAEALAVKIEGDTAIEEDLRRVVGVSIRACFVDASWFDHLPGEFVRRVVADGYVESQIPEAVGRLKNELAEYRAAYAKISKLTETFSGTTPGGDEAAEMKTYEDHAAFRIYDKATNATTFALKNPDDEKDALFILYDFPGKLKDFPDDWSPKTVRMTHQALGVTAAYDLETKKMTHDEALFKKAASLEMSALTPEYRAAKGLGEPWWSLPPHVLLVDRLGHTQGIVTPYGRLDIKDFNQIQDPAKRQLEMDEFLEQTAKVLPTPPYLHLFFRYFFEYILDSPITSKPYLMGSRAHAGDIHQTAYQSLQRLQGGRYVGDCDDLAETFMNLTRRQNKLSYVMALPQHAACGYAEKMPDDTYTFYVLDTGPPRMFKHHELDKVMELAYRAYDDDKTMRFDPKSLGFLFRFNGEPTRTPYWLSSRMFVDKEYGEIMERVQSYWHFHFYALGIQTMSQMIEKGDRVPENCIELAGLYGQVREVDDSVHWTMEALKQFGPQDKLSRFNEEFRIGVMWRDEHEDNDRDNKKAFEAVKNMFGELKRLQGSPDSANYISTRLELMGLLTGIERPWDAWDLVKRDMYFFASKGMLKIEHAGSLTSAYIKMKEMIKKGKVPTDAEKADLDKLEELLGWFYEKALFDQEDDFGDFMRKYAFLGEWYMGKYGRERLLAELMKGGPFPDPAKPRNHIERKNSEEEDWNWIRLSLSSYSIAMGDALNFDEPPEKWRKAEAVKLADLMMKAGNEARKFGSLGSAEFQMLSTRVFRAFLIKDWDELEKVIAATEQQDWARLTTDIAETFGRCARFVTPAEFETQYRMFTKHIKVRTAYYTVIYEAYRADAFEQAVAASKVALECNPKDVDMKRESVYLEQLAAKRQAKAKAKDKPAQGDTSPSSAAPATPATSTTTPASQPAKP